MDSHIVKAEYAMSWAQSAAGVALVRHIAHFEPDAQALYSAQQLVLRQVPHCGALGPVRTHELSQICTPQVAPHEPVRHVMNVWNSILVSQPMAELFVRQSTHAISAMQALNESQQLFVRQVLQSALFGYEYWLPQMPAGVHSI